MKILICPDKFKGTLTARQAAEALAEGWRKSRPQDELTLLPMSDGGDGFGEVLGSVLSTEPRNVETVDAAHRPINGRWGWASSSQIAIIETAQVIGLALLPAGKFHPFELDTHGLGAVFLNAKANGAEECLVGIGGSATNDGGFGLARALGWSFLDSKGRPIERWIGLDQLNRITPPNDPLQFNKLTIATDVLNPLLGPEGASRIYGPQKGLKEFEQAERCLSALADKTRILTGLDYASEPGAGAAGGLGFGLRVFLSGTYEQGFDVFSRYSGLDKLVRSTDLVLTGEGAIDRSTLMGKGVGALAFLSKRLNRPVIGLAGVLGDGVAKQNKTLTYMDAICPNLAALEDAKKNAAFWLSELAARTAKQWI